MSRRTRVALAISILAVILIPVVAVASDKFTDVPDSNIFHNDIAWMADNGITAGCNPPANDQYCPSATVTREQMAAFMHRLGVNQVVDAATAVTAGTANEAVHEAEEIITGTNSGTANSIATLDSLPVGNYVVTATWSATPHGASAGGRLVCNLSVGATTQQVIAFPKNPFGQLSMAGVVAGNITGGDEVNLSCWVESLVLTLGVHDTRIIAYPVTDVESVNVTN